MVRLLFLGSGEFPIPVFETITSEKKIKVVGLVTSLGKDQSEKKTKSLYEKAKENNIPIFNAKNLSSTQEKILRSTKPALILVCNFGQILNKKIINFPKYGSLNIHASLLPELRGACPIEMAIIKGFKKTGISIQRMEVKLDTGDILFQKVINISQQETGGSLFKKLQKLTIENINEVIIDWVNKKITPKKQDSAKATYCFRSDISKKAARINWNSRANYIERKIRALNPRVVAWTEVETNKSRQRLKIYKAKVLNKNLGEKPGEVSIRDDKFFIQTKDGLISPEVVQISGKNKMQTKEFLRGYKKDFLCI